MLGCHETQMSTFFFKLMDNGVIGQSGRPVVHHVMEAVDVGHVCVMIPYLPVMVCHVMELIQRQRIVMLTCHVS